MSYTLNQVELFALSETRRLAVTTAVREVIGCLKGQYFSSEMAYSMLKTWQLKPRMHYELSSQTFVDASAFCLDGCTLSEFQLYCRIEQQRVAIRTEERNLRTGETQYVQGSLLKVLRADFKSFLKEVQW